MLNRSWAALIVSVLLGGCAGAAFSRSGALTAPARALIHPDVVQTGGSSPQWIAVATYPSVDALFMISASDGNLWYTDSDNGNIGKVTPQGQITTFPVPSPTSVPYYMVQGPSSTLWFTEFNRGIGSVTTAGQVTEYPDPSSRWYHQSIAVAPDGNLWVSVYDRSTGAPALEKIAPSGNYLSTFFLAKARTAVFLARGPDGNIWFDDPGTGSIARVDPTNGRVKYFGSVHGTPHQIIAGPDGNLWVAVVAQPDIVARVTLRGHITEFKIPRSCAGNCGLSYLTVGPDGKIWWTDTISRVIGYTTVHGRSTVLFPPFGGQPQSIAAGSDGNLWFTDSRSVDVFVRHVITVTPPSVSLSGVGATQTIMVSETLYSGAWAATSSNPSVATVASSGSNSFVITAAGSGSATVSVTDSMNNVFLVSVLVT
jgi:virginiamycin B lyase